MSFTDTYEKYLDTLYAMSGMLERMRKKYKRLEKLADQTDDLGTGHDHIRDGMNELSIIDEMIEELETEEVEDEEDEEDD